MNEPLVTNQPVPEDESEKKRRKAFLFLVGLPILPLLGFAAWQSAGLPADPVSLQEGLSLVQEAQAATVRVDETLKAIDALLGAEPFSSLSAEERAQIIQSLGAEDQAELGTLLQALRTDAQAAAELAAQTGSATETSSADATTQEAAAIASDLSGLLAAAEQTLTAIQESAPADSTLAVATEETLTTTDEAQAALDALLADLTEQLVAAGLTEEEASALVGEIGEQMTNAWEHASEDGREGLLNAMEAQTRQETAPKAPETNKPQQPGRP